jgi:catechol 2,3-dioxygenase-like lactoylglutathione lyase family enzyme
LTAVPVPPFVSFAVLGVADVARATVFYEAIGWERSPASQPEISFFRTGGAGLILWDRDALAADANLEPTAPRPFEGRGLAINVATADAVTAALEVVAAAGGHILKHATLADWGGTSGYFADLDGHLWEVAHNPGFPLGPDGLPQLP